jgi:hypothetical protein
VHNFSRTLCMNLRLNMYRTCSSMRRITKAGYETYVQILVLSVCDIKKRKKPVYGVTGGGHGFIMSSIFIGEGSSVPIDMLESRTVHVYFYYQLLIRIVSSLLNDQCVKKDVQKERCTILCINGYPQCQQGVLS